MNTISQIFPKFGRISGPEVGDGAKPDVPTTDRQNEKKKHHPFYEAVDAHARCRLINYLCGGMDILIFSGTKHCYPIPGWDAGK